MNTKARIDIESILDALIELELIKCIELGNTKTYQLTDLAKQMLRHAVSYKE